MSFGVTLTLLSHSEEGDSVVVVAVPGHKNALGYGGYQAHPKQCYPYSSDKASDRREVSVTE